jgi:hypothetical protein
MTTALVISMVLAVAPATVKVPLPAAPVRVVIPDAKAFDAALSGRFREALTGELAPDDTLAKAWRQTQVGSKLEEQWSQFSQDLSWTWRDIKQLQPRSVGLALLAVGHLEAVLVIDTPLAVLPVTPPDGEARTHAGASYTFVTSGAADDADNPDRRMGLAWARSGTRLILATSERAMKLTLDEIVAGRALAAPLPGLISLELDLDDLRKDLYFKREFPFGALAETGRVRAALQLEGQTLVEVREGTGPALPAGVSFAAAGAAAAGWEPEGAGLMRAVRAALLEPLPVLAERPVTSLASLPAVSQQAPEERYLVSIEKPLVKAGGPVGEEGDLARWRALFEKQPVAGWGYLLGADGQRRLVFPWPAALGEELIGLCRATVERRAGRATVVPVGEAREIRVGPDLPALALRRAGEFVWIGPTARSLEALPTPQGAGDVVRWAKVDLAAVRNEGPRWAKAEGPGYAGSTRPLSDRILGLLGWMPATTALSVERRNTAGGWTERVVFGR